MTTKVLGKALQKRKFFDIDILYHLPIIINKRPSLQALNNRVAAGSHLDRLTAGLEATNPCGSFSDCGFGFVARYLE
jgi:hypothetical protein